MGLIPIIFKVITLFTAVVGAVLTISYIMYRVKNSKKGRVKPSVQSFQPQPIYAVNQNQLQYIQYSPSASDAVYSRTPYNSPATVLSKNRFQILNTPVQENYYAGETPMYAQQGTAYGGNVNYDIYRNYSNNRGERLQMVKVVA